MYKSKTSGSIVFLLYTWSVKYIVKYKHSVAEILLKINLSKSGDYHEPLSSPKSMFHSKPNLSSSCSI